MLHFYLVFLQLVQSLPHLNYFKSKGSVFHLSTSQSLDSSKNVKLVGTLTNLLMYTLASKPTKSHLAAKADVPVGSHPSF